MATLAPTTSLNLSQLNSRESLVARILPVMRTKSDGDLGMARLMSHSPNREEVSTTHCAQHHTGSMEGREGKRKRERKRERERGSTAEAGGLESSKIDCMPHLAQGSAMIICYSK